MRHFDSVARRMNRTQPQVKTEFHNKSREFYNENEDVAVMMFDINHGYRR